MKPPPHCNEKANILNRLDQTMAICRWDVGETILQINFDLIVFLLNSRPEFNLL